MAMEKFDAFLSIIMSNNAWQ